jgi:hypothetical protein
MPRFSRSSARPRNAPTLLLVALGVVTATLVAVESCAHGGNGASRAGQACLHESGSLGVDLSVYSAKDLDNARLGYKLQSHCPNIPSAGDVILVLDLDTELRDVPISVQVREQGAEARAVLQVPPKTYPFGVADIPVRFDRPSNYVVIVNLKAFGSGAAGPVGSVIRFPLQVGLGRGLAIPRAPLGAVLIAFFGAAAGYAVFRLRGRKA